MGRLLSGALLLMAVLAAGCRGSEPQPAELRMLVGTYTEGRASQGVYLYSYDPQTAGCVLLDTAAACNPSFVIPSEDRYHAYAVSEYGDGRQGVYSFRLRDNRIDLLNLSAGAGADPCNIVLADGNLITSDYSGGTLSVFPVLGDGSVDSMSFQYTPEKRDENTVSHIHCTAVSPDGRYIFVSDLGTDRIYRAELKGKGLPPWDFTVAYSFDTEMHPGPRHICFSPDGRYAYLISEPGDYISVFAYKDGELEHISTEKAYDGDGKGSADIHTSPDGKFVYTSHRLKEDGISVFRRDGRSGKLERVGFTPTGRHPRNFAISPDGRFLLCACRDSDRIEIYSIDSRTGLLSFTGGTVDVPAPVCISIY